MSGPVWCNYCHRYTVNGQCPSCGRIYVFNSNSNSSSSNEKHQFLFRTLIQRPMDLLRLDFGWRL